MFRPPPFEINFPGLSPFYASDRRMTISDEKQEELTQKLIELRDNQNVALPEEIRAALNDERRFVEGIDDYLTRPYNFVKFDHFDIVKTIVETCPEFLQPTWSRSMPPINSATMAIPSSDLNNAGLKFVLLFANVSLRFDNEGKESRGYLLTRNNFHSNSLQMVKDSSTYNALKENDPPLFFTSDILKYKLVHNQALYLELDVIKYLVDLEPSCVQQTNDDNELPIHCTMYGGADKRHKECIQTVEYLLQKGVSFTALKENIGGLFTEMPDRREVLGPGPGLYRGYLLLELLIKKLGEKKVWDCIERALSKCQNIDQLPILHQTITHTPEYCSEVMSRFPTSVHVRDANNRLPIHVALERGMKFSLELTHLIACSQEHLREVDPVTRWPSYVLAGMGTSCDLRTIYSLLHKYPEQSEMCCNKSEKKGIGSC